MIILHVQRHFECVDSTYLVTYTSGPIAECCLILLRTWVTVCREFLMVSIKTHFHIF